MSPCPGRPWTPTARLAPHYHTTSCPRLRRWLTTISPTVTADTKKCSAQPTPIPQRGPPRLARWLTWRRWWSRCPSAAAPRTTGRRRTSNRHQHTTEGPGEPSDQGVGGEEAMIQGGEPTGDGTVAMPWLGWTFTPSAPLREGGDGREVTSLQPIRGYIGSLFFFFFFSSVCIYANSDTFCYLLLLLPDSSSWSRCWTDRCLGRM